MNFDVTARDSASREFLAMAEAAERLESKLQRLDRLRVEPSAQLNITSATRSAQQLQQRLDALRNVRATVEVPGAAEARRDVTALVVEMRKLRNARVRIDLDGGAQAAVAALSTQLRTMPRDLRVKVGLDDGTFARDIARLHQRVSSLSGTTVRIDFDIRPPDVEARLASIAASLRALQGTTRHRVDVDTGTSSAAVAALSTNLKTMLKVGGGGLAIPGLISTVGQVGSLGASVMSLTGVLGLLPAAGAVGGAAMATFALGLAHVGDALGPTGTPAQIKKVEEALAALSPSARSAVDTIRGLGPAFSGMRLEVQEQLFRGMGEEIGRVGNTYLPILKTGLGGVAQELNLGAKGFTQWATEGRTIADVNVILGNTRSTMRELAPAGTNVAAALTDIATVGSGLMPELASGATAATARFREFVAEARRTGELEQWIRGGIATLEQLGRVGGNTGGILGSVFSASEEAGYGFLDAVEQVTRELDVMLSSTAGRNALVSTFAESRDAVNALLPGIRELTGATLDTVGAFARTDGLERFAATISATGSAVSPLVRELGELAGGTLGALAGGAQIAVGALTPVIGLAGGVVDGLGPVAPAVLAAVIAFRGLGLVTPILATLGTQIASTAALSGTMAAGLTGSLAAGAAAQAGMTRLGTAVGAVGKALPIVGVAAVGLGLALSSMSTSTDQAVAAMQAGGVAAEMMKTKLLEQSGVAQAGRSGFDDWANSLNTWVNSNVFGIASIESTNTAMDQQRATMSALQRAQQDLTAAQGNYQREVDRGLGVTPAVLAAAGEVALATDRVEQEQRAAAAATQSHTDRMVEQADTALASANADVAYSQAVTAVEQAQIRAAEATRDHGASSLEARIANDALTAANLAAAEAAGRKAAADAEATVAGSGAEAGARAQREELIRLADQATGPTRQALLDAANAMGTQGGAAGNAEERARFYKDELGRLAEQATGSTSGALRTLSGNFDTMGGAAASAEERARLQKDELLRLAQAASGPLRDSLTRMAEQVAGLPDGSFTVTATGVTQFKFTSSGEVLGVGNTGLATGGVWSGPGRVQRFADAGIMPGYTPGRDVHRFVSPTGGVLDLSGGEPVMRPEFGRAMGPAWIHGANRAARSGGISGVQNFVARTAPRISSVEGQAGDGSRFAAGGIRPTRYTGPVRHQRFAGGGLIQNGAGFTAMTPDAHIRTANEARARLIPVVQKQLREHEARVKAAQAASGSGPTTAGASAGLAWARTQVGKPYVWGGVGPGGYDCSGFMSAIVNVMRGRNPHSRVGATGNFPWGGFAPGIGPGLNIGAFKGNPGHMAGTIGGVNVESSGSVGVRVGGGARGAGDGMFTTRAHLADRGGMFASGTAALNLSGRAERALTGRQNEAFERFVDWATRSRGTFAAGAPLPVATPIGPGNPIRSQLQDAMQQPRALVAGPRLDMSDMLRELTGLRGQFAAITDAVRDARPITQTIQTSDPVEAGRTAVLALRLAHR